MRSTEARLLKVGVIGENHNQISFQFLERLLACETLRVIWFVDASLGTEQREQLYGKTFSWGPLGKTLRALKGFHLVPHRTPTCEALAKRHAIPFYRPRGHDINRGLPNSFYAASGATYVLVAGCDQLLKQSALMLARQKVINFHWSLLPGYRGKFAVFWQWYLREPNIGFSFHEVDLGVDTGTVLYQEAVPHSFDDSSDVIARRIVEHARARICELFEYAEAGQRKVFPDRIAPSFFPASRFLELVTLTRARSVGEVGDVFRRVGYLRLRNGFLLNRLEGASNVPLGNCEVRSGMLRIPLADGHIYSPVGKLGAMFWRRIVADAE